MCACTLTEVLAAFEHMLSRCGGTYCFGESVSLADVVLAPQIEAARRSVMLVILYTLIADSRFQMGSRFQPPSSYLSCDGRPRDPPRIPRGKMDSSARHALIASRSAYLAKC